MSTLFCYFAQFVTFCKSGIFYFAVFLLRIYYSANMQLDGNVTLHPYCALCEHIKTCRGRYYLPAKTKPIG